MLVYLNAICNEKRALFSMGQLYIKVFMMSNNFSFFLGRLFVGYYYDFEGH